MPDGMTLKLILKEVLTHHSTMGLVLQIRNNLDLTYQHSMRQEMQMVIQTKHRLMV